MKQKKPQTNTLFKQMLPFSQKKKEKYVKNKINLRKIKLFTLNVQEADKACLSETDSTK